LPQETCFQQAGSSMVEGTSQTVLGSSNHPKVPPAVTISKQYKNLSSALHRKGILVQVLLWFLTCSLGLLALGTDLKSRKGLYSGPSPIQNAHWSRQSNVSNDACCFSFFLSSEYSLLTQRVSPEKQKENYFCCGAIL
jgi:hypothetical protein